MRSNRPEMSCRSSGVITVSWRLHTSGHVRRLNRPTRGAEGNLKGLWRSENRAARSHWPDRLDVRIRRVESTDADVPIVEVHGRVTVAGDEEQLISQLRPVLALGEIEYAMLVRGPMIFGTGQKRHFRKTGIIAQSFVPGVDHCTLRRRSTHDCGEQEEGMLERVKAAAVRLLIAGVIRVHEDVGARLKLVPDAA